ncbi:MAG: hypothetical protein U5R06_08305 [candidate division KSB1 bacterium]|nr:hypothetical protein [candidate division KSB1 bacterium]
MKSFKRSVSIIAVALMAVIIALTGCSTDNAVSPTSSANQSAQGKIVQSDIGPVQILSLKSAPLAKSAAEQFIVAKEGGTIAIGNNTQGISKIVFKPNDLPKDMSITFSWAIDEYCIGEFGPHGTQFNSPVRVELSYKAAELTNVDEENLRISYYNENTNVWEVLGGKTDVENKVLIAYLEHFSRYAIIVV